MKWDVSHHSVEEYALRNYQCAMAFGNSIYVSVVQDIFVFFSKGIVSMQVMKIQSIAVSLNFYFY